MLEKAQRNGVPSSQLLNFKKVLENALTLEQETNQSTPEAAFLTAGIKILGFDPEDGYLTDGPKDHGFDFVHLSNDSCTIFQSKTLSYLGGINIENIAGPNYLDDVRQIQEVISNLDRVPVSCNKETSKALTALRNEIARRGLNTKVPVDDVGSSAYPISVILMVLAKDFTAQARGEFELLRSKEFKYAGSKIEVSVVPIFIDDLLDELWTQRNHDWKDRKGTKRDKIQLHVSGEVIKDAKTAIFYAKAYDFVEAFDSLGYQIFEPNVRSEIKDSKVNRAIKDTVTTREGRRDFKHLNNGVTVICDGYSASGPKDKPQSYEVRRPGVVNGLQTVKSLHDAYRRLKSDDQVDFRENCFVLCRLHQEGSVKRIDDLIRATNNQNPMKPRNLRSNDPEQRAFESLFAELGWFFERKEGSWNAFVSDTRSWKSLGGKRADFFATKNGYKRVDNAEVAQNWLAFIGFSTEAINEKRMLFAEDHLYKLIFQSRTIKHGFDYDFKLSKDTLIYTESLEQSPNPACLLLAHLSRDVADSLAPSRRVNRDKAIKNLGLANKSRDEQDREIDNDPEYQKGKMLRGMLTLFVEFVGFVLFRSYGVQAHEKAGSLLKIGSMKPIYERLDYSQVVTRYEERLFEKSDLLLILFCAFTHCVGALYDSTWLRAYNDAPVKNKMIYSVKTRKLLLEELMELDKRFARTEWVRDWADGFHDSKGIFKHVRNLLG